MGFRSSVKQPVTWPSSLGASSAHRAANGESSHTVRARAGRVFFPLSWPKDSEWGVLKLSPSLREGWSLLQGCPGPRQKSRQGQGRGAEGGQRADVLMP